MFPKKASDAYIQSTGERSTLGAVIGSGGGGGSELPEHTAADAGKVLSVTESNTLDWVTLTSKNTFTKSNTVVSPGFPNTDIGGV